MKVQTLAANVGGILILFITFGTFVVSFYNISLFNSQLAVNCSYNSIDASKIKKNLSDNKIISLNKSSIANNVKSIQFNINNSDIQKNNINNNSIKNSNCEINSNFNCHSEVFSKNDYKDIVCMSNFDINDNSNIEANKLNNENDICNNTSNKLDLLNKKINITRKYDACNSSINNKDDKDNYIYDYMNNSIREVKSNNRKILSHNINEINTHTNIHDKYNRQKSKSSNEIINLSNKLISLQLPMITSPSTNTNANNNNLIFYDLSPKTLYKNKKHPINKIQESVSNDINQDVLKFINKRNKNISASGESLPNNDYNDEFVKNSFSHLINSMKKYDKLGKRKCNYSKDKFNDNDKNIIKDNNIKNNALIFSSKDYKSYNINNYDNNIKKYLIKTVNFNIDNNRIEEINTKNNLKSSYMYSPLSYFVSNIFKFCSSQYRSKATLVKQIKSDIEDKLDVEKLIINDIFINKVVKILLNDSQINGVHAEMQLEKERLFNEFKNHY